MPLTRLLAAWLLVGWLLPFVPVAADPLAASCPALFADDTTASTTTDAAGHAAAHHCPACGMTLAESPHQAPATRSPDHARGCQAGYPSRRIDPPYRPPPLA